jgi:hypothetical protein
MELRPIQAMPVYPGAITHQSGRGTRNAPENGSPTAGASPAGGSSVLSSEETAFFEGLFPDSQKDVRAHKAYSTKGEQQQSAVTGTLVDRKG